ncbi:MAG TPA: hypothetical protein VEX70_12875 [Pyrinomonadaceae bacterium]|nr:hypothetical protein [Pyrinomonadaceae bacterium]
MHSTSLRFDARLATGAMVAWMAASKSWFNGLDAALVDIPDGARLVEVPVTPSRHLD